MSTPSSLSVASSSDGPFPDGPPSDMPQAHRPQNSPPTGGKLEGCAIFYPTLYGNKGTNQPSLGIERHSPIELEIIMNIFKKTINSGLQAAQSPLQAINFNPAHCSKASILLSMYKLCLKINENTDPQNAADILIEAMAKDALTNAFSLLQANKFIYHKQLCCFVEDDGEPRPLLNSSFQPTNLMISQLFHKCLNHTYQEQPLFVVPPPPHRSQENRLQAIGPNKRTLAEINKDEEVEKGTNLLQPLKTDSQANTPEKSRASTSESGEPPRKARKTHARPNASSRE